MYVISKSIWQCSQKVILAPCTTHCSFTELHCPPSPNKSFHAHHLSPPAPACTRLPLTKQTLTSLLFHLFGRWTTWSGNSQSCPPARRASGSGVLHGIFFFPSCWIRNVINNKYIRSPEATGIRFCQRSPPPTNTSCVMLHKIRDPTLIFFQFLFFYQIDRSAFS